MLADIDPKVRKELDDYGLTAKIGASNVHDSVSEVVAAYRKASEASADQAGPASTDESAPQPG